MTKGNAALRRFAPSSGSDVLMGLVGLSVSVFLLVAVWFVAAVTVGYLSGSGSATAIATLIGMGLVSGLVVPRLVHSARPRLRGLGAGLGAGAALVSIVLAGGVAWTLWGGYGMSSSAVARELAGSVDPENPGVYLGERGAAGNLVSIEHQGRGLIFRYGRCIERWGEDGCTPAVEITNEPAESWLLYPGNGCERVEPILGVPAVVSAHTLTLFTGSSAVSVFAYTRNSEGFIGDTQRALELAAELRPVGAAGPVDALPPPSPEARGSLERCAAQAK